MGRFRCQGSVCLPIGGLNMALNSLYCLFRLFVLTLLELRGRLWFDIWESWKRKDYYGRLDRERVELGLRD